MTLREGLAATSVVAVLDGAQGPTVADTVAAGIQPVICYNGAWTGRIGPDRMAQSCVLKLAVARSVARTAHEAEWTVMWYGPSVVHAPLRIAEIARRQAAVTGDPLQLEADLDALTEPPFKLMVVTPVNEVTPAVDLLRARCGSAAAIAASGPGLIEIVAKGVDKAVAAADMAQSLGCTATDCAAVGDSGNDIEMLRWAGLPLTVANGLPEARQLARFEGGHCDEGGLAPVIDWLLALPAPPITAEACNPATPSV